LINRFGSLEGFERVAERFVAIAGLKQSPSSEETPITSDANIAETENTISNSLEVFISL